MDDPTPRQLAMMMDENFNPANEGDAMELAHSGLQLLLLVAKATAGQASMLPPPALDMAQRLGLGRDLGSGLGADQMLSSRVFEAASHF